MRSGISRVFSHTELVLCHTNRYVAATDPMEQIAIMDEIVETIMNPPGSVFQYEESGEWSSMSQAAAVRQTKQALGDELQRGARKSSVKSASFDIHQRGDSRSASILEECQQRREAGQVSVKPTSFHDRQRGDSPSVSILEEYEHRREAGRSSVKPASFHEHQPGDSPSVSILEEYHGMPQLTQDSPLQATSDDGSPYSSCIPPALLYDFDALLVLHFQEWLATLSRSEPACHFVSGGRHAREGTASAIDASP
jgi:hypothetical protein